MHTTGADTGFRKGGGGGVLVTIKETSVVTVLPPGVKW